MEDDNTAKVDSAVREFFRYITLGNQHVVTPMGMIFLEDVSVVKGHRRGPDHRPHQILMGLIEKLENRTTNDYDIKSVCEFCKCLTKLGFDQRGTILKLNEINPQLQGRAREFLQDTVNFIETGKRKMSIASWQTLLSVDPKERYNCWAEPLTGEVKKEDYILDVEKKVSSETYVARWLLQENGFEDMLCSIKLLFGEPPVVNYY